MSSFSDRLKALHPGEPRGWQARVSEVTGVSKPTVSEWASGKIGGLKPEHLFKLADHYKVHARWLALGTGPKMRMDSEEPLPQPVFGIADALSVLHGAAVQINSMQRSHVLDLMRIYLGDPVRYAKLLPDIEQALMGEIPISQSQISNGTR
ncbi:helix-turn-helix domain-containing protein [Variovorax sp. N23]|uniref:helix-turn-helix domain-containing protein n=1 Tax=Variovorax sp. N23 TaxID=2980555 RepID=UPI0021C5EB34|nr:helix-turn-helix transcriptional regulator [Variovorax sp. N23]MCU4119339.1 helix-turn-helix transcriptional regulator [Variovorax sp. N23]